MAKTWTLKEAYEALKANDVDAISDFGKRFPLATTALARGGANIGLDTLFGAFPDRVTMRTVEIQLKQGVSESAGEDDGDEDEVEEKPAKKAEKKPAKEAPKADKKSAKAEKPKKDEKPAKKAATKKQEVEEDEDDDEDGEEEVDYSTMGAVELFKLCKSRGIKVEPKQKAKVYIDALKAADAGDDDEDDGDDDDNWDI